MPDHFLDFDLFALPASSSARQPSGAETPPPPGSVDANLLVLHDGHRDFLNRVLAAAGYDDLGRQVLFLQRDNPGAPLDLPVLVATTGVRRVLLFGQDLPALGLHLDVRGYHQAYPTRGYVVFTLNGVRYLAETDVGTIATANDAGDKTGARRLWAGMKDGLLRENP